MQKIKRNLIFLLLLFTLYSKAQFVSYDTKNNFYNSNSNNVRISEPYSMYIRVNYINGVISSSDTTEVIYVLLREKYVSEFSDSTRKVSYPYIETIYGYHVQKWRPYGVEFYDAYWNPILEEELLFIKKRKLK